MPPRRRASSRSALWLPAVLALGGLVSLLCFLVLLPLAWWERQGGTLPVAASPPTVLILGIDRRPDEGGPTRSDSMILLGFNRETQEAAILSIPRDLWVEVPGVGPQRINTATFFGYDAEDPTAAPRLAVRTVAASFGLPVDRFLLLDFQTFVRLVDALGGVEVDVPKPITDTQYPTPDYGVTTIHFDAGRQVLDGERALIYVRTRHADDDFGRARRQQQVVQALAQRLLQPSTWPRLPAAYQVLQEGVITDLQLADLLALLPVVRAIGRGEVMQATLDEGLTTPWITPSGAWVLLPNWPAIRSEVRRLFGSPAP